jgi:hypothetical protein
MLDLIHANNPSRLSGFWYYQFNIKFNYYCIYFTQIILKVCPLYNIIKIILNLIIIAFISRK